LPLITIVILEGFFNIELYVNDPLMNNLKKN